MALILIADPAPTSREYVLHQLRQTAYKVITASDGREALELARQRRPDVIVTDVFLPGLDGYEFVHELRRDPALAATPVIFYTVAYHAHEVRSLSGACGVAHVVLKASQPERLLRAIDSALEQKQRRLARTVNGSVEALEAENRRLAALVELTQQIAAEGEPLRLLHNFCHASRAIIGARLAALGILDETGRTLAHFLTSGLDPQIAFQLATLSPVRGVLGRLLENGEPVRLNGEDIARGDFPPPHPDVDSFLGVPVATANEMHGWLYLVGRYGDEPFTEDDQRVVVTLAAQIALAYESARRHEQSEQHAARLEQAKGREAELEKELKRRLKELAEAEQRRDQFLGMLAHELRNPLAPIGNALHVLRLSPPGSPSSERAQTVIERQYTHLARLVDDVLEVSRVQRGKVKLKKERLDLAKLVRASAEDHRGLVEIKGLVLQLELPPLPMWVDGDSTRLAQVLDHLLQNAVRFTDPGGRIHVQAAVDNDKKQAVVRIRDTGVGVDPEFLPNLFQTFIQADRSLDRKQGGLGLGLTLVRRLIHMHGGEVWASSPGLGQGAEFGFRLPLLEATPTPPVEVRKPSRAPCHRRVLIVEDNPDTAATLRMLLEMSGCEVNVAGTGPDGVECALKWKPDVILCDIGLPGGMDGYAVARTVRQNPAMAQTRLIAVTGYGRDEDRRRCHEAGFDMHFTKPVDPEELTNQLLAEPSAN